MVFLWALAFILVLQERDLLVTAIIMRQKFFWRRAVPKADCVVFRHQLQYREGSAHKQHVILLDHVEIIASAGLSVHGDPDTCHTHKGPDVSSEQPTPEIKTLGSELKPDKITIRVFSGQSLSPRLRKQKKTMLTKALTVQPAELWMFFNGPASYKGPDQDKHACSFVVRSVNVPSSQQLISSYLITMPSACPWSSSLQQNGWQFSIQLNQTISLDTAADPASVLSGSLGRGSWCNEHDTMHGRLDIIEEKVIKTVEHLEVEVKSLLNIISETTSNIPIGPETPLIDILDDTS